jgi:hypothetical protein
MWAAGLRVASAGRKRARSMMLETIRPSIPKRSKTSFRKPDGSTSIAARMLAREVGRAVEEGSASPPR